MRVLSTSVTKQTGDMVYSGATATLPPHWAYQIELEAMDDAHDVVIFEDFGDGQTKLTLIGSEPMESARNSGRLEGWNEILDKVAAVVAELAQEK